MSYKLKLSGDKIIVEKREEEEVNQTGLYVPDLSASKPLIGTIVEISKDVIGYKKGEDVMYLKGGIDIPYQDKECVMLTYGQVVGNIEYD